MMIRLPDDRIRVDGAVAVVESDGGIAPHRLDPARAHQHPIEVSFVAGMTSGVRLVTVTDADEVAITCTPVRLALGGAAPLAATFDVTVDGALVSSAAADFGHVVSIDLDGASSFEAGGPDEVVLTGLPPGTSTIEIWLPQSAGVELRSLRVPDGSTVRAAEPDDRPRWVHHGSSISQCMEADRPTGTWPAIAAAATGHHLVNLGLAGQCHLDQFTARLLRDLDADRISLELGINIVNADSMTRRTFASAVHGFLDTVRDGHPRTPVLVVSPISCPVAEDVPGPTVLTSTGRIEALGSPEGALLGRLGVGAVRSVLAEVVAARVAAGDDRLSLLDGRDLFGPDDVDDHLPDGLHPDAVGYERMGRRFAAHPFMERGPEGGAVG